MFKVALSCANIARMSWTVLFSVDVERPPVSV